MFTLGKSSEYLKGRVERKVNFEPYLYYYTEAFWGKDDEISYKKSVSKYINPAKMHVNVCLSIHEGSNNGIIYPINCNCVLKIKNIFALYKNNEKRDIVYRHNGTQFGDSLWFVQSKPEIFVQLDGDEIAVEIELLIMQYDFKDNFTQIMYEIMCEQSQKLAESVAIYEQMIACKDQEFRESVNTYERMIERKDQEFRESVNAYEKEMERRELEYRESLARLPKNDLVNNKRKRACK